MNTETIITELERINRWRRGDESEQMPDPKHFGEVIDAAITSLRSLIASNTTLRRERSEARAEVSKLKAALELGQENCNAEYEELREERDEALRRIDQLGLENGRLISEVDRFSGELAALRRDKERLDWISARPVNSFAAIGIYRDHDTKEYWIDSAPSLACLTLRDAIDAASEGGAK